MSDDEMEEVDGELRYAVYYSSSYSADNNDTRVLSAHHTMAETQAAADLISARYDQPEVYTRITDAKKQEFSPADNIWIPVLGSFNDIEIWIGTFKPVTTKDSNDDSLAAASATQIKD